jgi:rubrerythrin
MKNPAGQKATPASGAATKDITKEASSAPKKLRRSRVPGNLAQMYGENAAKRDLEPAPAAEPEKKARRDAKAREKRRALMQVDDTLLQRLSQTKSGPTALTVGEDGAPTRRGRTWQEACGKCGTHSTFRTAGALCPVCGAICLRDAA